MYAIVDIETTGSHPAGSGILEIAIVLHNGVTVEGKYETLINPQDSIPPYIVHLTGINQLMTEHAPLFSDVASHIYNLLHQRIFVAHNVNFDFSFLKHFLQESGYYWQPKKLCTMRLSRKIFPGLPKYGLGALTKHFDIENTARHRAGGDATATAKLFEIIINAGGEKFIRDALKKESHDQILPPHLPTEQVKVLPMLPGVYYFKDKKDKIIYVGKAKNIRKRVLSHFMGLNTGKKRQEFLRNIYAVSCQVCPTELTAFILESVEIKKYWPAYNQSQKHFTNLYGIYSYEDARGFLRLGIDRKRKSTTPLATYTLLTDAHRSLWQVVRKHALHPALCFLEKNQGFYPENLEVIDYNKKVTLAMHELTQHAGTYVVIENTVNGKNKSCVLVENGTFYGFGLIPKNLPLQKVKKIKPHLTPYPDNEVIHSLLRSYKTKNSVQVIALE